MKHVFYTALVGCLLTGCTSSPDTKSAPAGIADAQIKAEGARAQWRSHIEAQIPTGRKVGWNIGFDKAVSDVSSGQAELDSVSGLVFDTAESHYEVAQASGSFCLLRNAAEPSAPQLLCNTCPRDMPVGYPIAAVARFWEIKDTSPYTSLAGQEQLMVMLVPHQLLVPQEPPR